MKYLLDDAAVGTGAGTGFFSSLVEALHERSAQFQDRQAYTFLTDGEDEAEDLTYAKLHDRARSLAGALQRLGLGGENALLLFPAGLEFISAFFGCLYGGVVAVPAYPPRLNRAQPRLRAIARDAGPRAVLTTSAILAKAGALREQIPELRDALWLATDDPAFDGAAAWRDPGADGDTLAFLQYTSGSTSTPKGVMVTHGNLLHNQEMIRCAFGQDEGSVIAGWLPLYHDMGLIGNVLQPLYVGGRCVLMSPHAFLQRPLRWLEAISRHGATTSGGPNFAYDLCSRKVREADLAGLDLSRWNVAFNGAEPVRPETLERFAQAFASAGFRREAFYPCYGLAEGTLFAAGGLRGRAPEVRAFEASALERNRAVPAEDGAAARRLVGCGRPWMEQEIVVVDPASGERCAAGRVGEIWISGPSVARGYWGREEETLRTFGAKLAGSARPFLRTGDLGTISDGEVFVTGRLKDLVILRGRNLYPQDIERTVEASHPVLRAGCGAAFSVEVAGEERLVVVQEVERRRDRLDVDAVAEAVRLVVAEEHEAQVHEVVLLEAGAIPKTSSGKIQRHACRAGYLEGSLAVVGRSAAAVAAGGEEDAPAFDRGALLSLPAEQKQAAIDAFLAGRIAHLTGLNGAAGDPAAGRSLVSLGLDSLMVVELRNALETGLGVEVPMTTLLQGSGIAELAAAVLAALEGTAADETAGAGALEPERCERPLTPGQRGLWLLDRVAPDCGVCNIGGAARLRSPLDPDALRQAFLRLARRHPALRTVFGSRDEEPWQRVEADLELGFAVHDASGWSRAELEECLLEEIYRPFDLARGPLVRAAIWMLAPGDAVLSLAAHHLISDLWSLVVMLRDLGALYEEESGGAPAELPPLAVSPAHHFHWQERVLSGERGERLWSYWSERLAAPLPIVELPADRLRPAMPNHAGSSVGFHVQGAAADRLRELARKGDATLYMVLLGALLALVHRQTGQEDLLIGSPTSGRTLPGCEPLVGYLVNPVALRAQVDGGAPFASLLARVREAVLGAFDHQDYPFALLAERLQGPRDASRSPVFQLAFVFQKPHLPELAGLGAFALGEAGGVVRCGSLSLESVGLPQARVQIDLTLVMAERDGGLGAAFQYATDLFDRATIERLASQMGVLLEVIATGPRLAVGDLPVLSASEDLELLVEWNRTGMDVPGDLCLHELFEAQVERAPEAVAVIWGEERLSYRELEQRSNRLAHHLRSLGVGPETRVGVCLERSPDLIAALLGVLKAGGAYVPLDSAYPSERIAFMLEDSQASVLLTRERLDEDREALAAASAQRPGRAAEPGHLAYVIYTSGSTGRPKGVAIEHAAPVVLSCWARELFGAEALSRVLASTSVCFDLSVFEIFVPLSWGGAVVLVDNALGLPEAPAAGEVTLINTVPSALAELLRMGALPASAATVNLAGEPLPRALAWQAYAVPSVRQLFNLYGPSEDTTYSTFALVEGGDPGAPPIGRPIANTRAYVLDRRLHPAPVGVPGELYLGGRGLARGYLGRPELTAERFVPDGFGAAGGRLYRTGDLVRWRPDGELEFLGRLDHQVKIRGFRIELGEIESRLAAHPEVCEVVVTARQDALGERRLVAYVVGETPALAVSELREHLRRSLPEHMVPAAWVVLAALPLTPNGKVDRKALPAPEGLDGGEADFAAPRTPLQELLARLWAELLGRERIGLQEGFFDLGGHSLLAARVVARLREVCGVELPVRALFESPTVELLAARVEEALHGGERSLAPPLVREARGESAELPLSFAQERLWFLDQLEPGRALYNIAGGIRLDGDLEPAMLAAALTGIVRRHEALRTTIAAVDGRPVQRAAAAVPVPLPVMDLRALPETARRTEARRLAEAEGLLPFDLARGPLARFGLVRLGELEHALLLSFHHIVADGWSLEVLARELTALYAAAVAGRRSPLPELPVQYADYAAWQRRWLAGEVLDRQLDYWRRRLDGAQGALEMPADRPRPSVRSFRGGELRFSLDAGLTASLEALGRRSGATFFMTLLAAWTTLLQRSTGEADVRVGSPIANRSRVETEGLIGLFVNTLVLRTDLAGDPGFIELLARVRRGTLEAYGHQDVPLERLVEELQPERDLAHTPLFQVLFALQNAPWPVLELPGLAVRSLPTARVTAKFDLTLTLEEGVEGLQGSLVFASDLFDATTAARLASHFRTLLAGVAAAPEARISALPLLSGPERSQLLEGWNDTRWPAAWGGGLHRLFAEQARRTPTAVALVWEPAEGAAEVLSFRELDERSNRLAHHLRDLGVGPDVPVGLLTERSPEMVVGLLGILKAGGAYVPLDPRQPEPRLAFVLCDAGAPVLVTQGRPEGLPGVAVELVRLDADRDRIAKRSAADPGIEVAPDHLAYVIYTSGTTGAPKGAMIRHAAVENLLAALGRAVYADVDRPLRVSVNAPLAFDASVKQWIQLLHGHALALVPEEVRVDGEELLGFLERNRVDVLDCTPSQLRLLLEAGLDGRHGGPRRMLVGGEAVSNDLWQRLAASDLAVYDVYGPTECTVDTVVCRITAEPPGPVIGRPIANVGVRVLDPLLRLVPAGVPGELCIAGAGLARGYLGRPDLTAEKFIPDPFATEPGARLYRSGDRSRWLADGRIEFLGRVDHQVKIRGFRIEPEEVAAVLALHPAVRRCAVVAREDLPGGLGLAAYVVAGEPVAAAELRDFLRERLPEPMVPSAVAFLDALPLTPNGKLDRRALPSLSQIETEEAVEMLATPVEELLAGIWSELLGIGRVGRHEGFFDLGGHSLLATRMVARIRQVLGVELSLREVFALPTLAALAKRITGAMTGAGEDRSEPIRPVSRCAGLPLSFAQERLWFLDRLQPGVAVYNVPAILRLMGDLSLPALAAVLAEISRRHEALRTTFVEASEGPVQRIGDGPLLKLPVVDLRGCPQALREPELRRLAAAEAERPFDLERGPLARATLVWLGEQNNILLLTLHHIVSDGWSMGVLVREVAELYGALAAGRPSPLPELSIQYADFAVWQRRWLAEGALESQLAWWHEQLAGTSTALDLSSDRPRPPVQSFRGRREPFRLDAELGERLRSLGRQEGATLYMVLLAAFQILLARHSGQDDLLVGSPVAGRSRIEVEGLIGFFVNTLVLRGDLRGDPTLRELLAHARAASLGAFDHQDVPFERLVEKLEPQRDLSRNPLFQAMLALHNTPLPRLDLPGLEVDLLDVDSGTSRFDITLSLVEQGGGLVGWMEHSTDLFDGATVRRMLDRFEALLRGLATGPERRASDLPVLSASEELELLVEWNRTGMDVPRDLCLHELFEAQVERAPEAVAVIWGEERLSYRELELRSNRLAHHLRSLGVGPETRVGVCLKRSPDLIAALLGVLKAGGAYVPLDPTYPSERIAFMQEDSQAAVLLTRKRLDEDREALAAASAQRPGRAAEPGHLAYVIYTSGSTGRPKGVAIEHAAPVVLSCWARELFGAEALSRVLASTSVCFDLSVFEIFVPLSWGGAVVLVDNALGLPEAPAAGEVTLINTVPSALAELLRMGALPASAATVNLAGEPLPRALAWQACAVPSVRRLFNLYGPSEDTTYSTFALVEGGEPGAPPIGRPVANTRAYVLDRRLHPAPVGVPGELYLGGGGLARGYLGRPELTAERFVPDGFGAAGGRLYRTGDLVRWRPDGELEFLGRLDHQVKIRGFRIELGEIEAVLVGLPGVREAAVLAPGEEAERRLVAYVAASGLAAPALRASLRERLPEHMVPAAWVVLAALPLTPNGKVDRKALAALAPEVGLQSAAAPQAPRTPTEETLAAIWCEVLGREAVSVRDDFFELGGHSLLAARVVSRVREILGVDLPLRALFEERTVEGLGTLVEQGRAAAGGRQWRMPTLERWPRPARIPLSFAQQRMWLIDQMEQGQAAYNLPLALRLESAPDLAVLAASLDEIIRRHESLRTTFAAEGGEPSMVIASPAPVPMPLLDLSGLPETERWPEAERQWRQERIWSFDLARGPLVRVRLLRLGRGEHLLLVTLHHIVADGWSLEVLVRELTALYGAFVSGAPSPLPELPIQYVDFALWQRSWLRGDVLEEQLAFWRDRLAGAAPLLELPTDRPRPAVRSFRGGRQTTRLPETLSTSLRQLGRRHGLTLFMTLLAAYQVLLSRLSGQADVNVGTPVAGRRDQALESLIGLFVNSLTLRADLSGDPGFTALAAAARESVLEAHAHQDVSFEQVVEALQPQRSLGHSPLFQVMFAVREQGFEVPDTGPLRLEPLARDTETAKVDLILTLAVTGRGLHASLEHSADLFDPATAGRFLGCFQALLEGIAAAPETPVAALPLVPEAQRQQLLMEWNDSGSAYPSAAGLAELFAAQVARSPEAVAVVYGGESLSYAELGRRAGHLARTLRQAGVGQDARVGISLGPGLDLVVALLAIIKAGGCYVPLDPAYPRERLSFMLDDAQPALVVTAGGALDDLLSERNGLRILRLDDGAAEVTGAAACDRGPAAGPDHLAYIIYTSGSTGRPKGVAVPQRAVARLVLGTDYADLGPADRVAQASNTSFDAATFEIWGALLTGGTLVGVSRDVALAPAELAVELRRQGITVLFLTTALFNQIARQEPQAFSGLRLLLFGGEAVDPRWVRRILREGSPQRLLHVYGPTENTTFSTWQPVAAVREDAVTVPIGRPLANSTAHVVDRGFRPVPAGIVGELWVGGEGLARGYWSRPEATAEKFVPNPWSERPGGRLYRTGDLVRLDGRGAIEFVGRVDHQVKVRGFRIELGEIEAALSAHPAVREAVVLAREDAPGERRLVGYGVARNGLPATAELRAFLKERLPEYMVPAAFVWLPALPLTPNGKVDRRALPVPQAAQDAAGEAAVLPRTPAEEMIAGIWSELLGVARIGADDDFFELGGHSLLATQMVSRLRAAFGVDLPLRALFEGPTVSALARSIESGLLRSGAPEAPPLEAVPRDLPLPLSYSQQQFWFLQRMEPESSAYTIFLPLHLAGRLDVAVLAWTLDEIVRRHEVLRTTFVDVDGAPEQRIAARTATALPQIDLGGLEKERREAELRRLAGKERRRPFDLAAGPLLRVLLVRLGAAEHAVLAALHHIAGDGWSLGVLTREIGELYAARCAGRTAPLPDLPIQYADFAHWQRRWLSGEVLEEQLAYWRDLFGGACDPLRLPTERPRHEVADARSAFSAVALSPAVSAELVGLSRSADATLFMTLLAGYMALLRCYAQQEDILVGTPIANRQRIETEGLIGLFTNTLVLRADLSGNPTFREVIARVRETALGAYAHQDLPFVTLVESLRLERDPSRSPLFQVWFVLQNTPRAALDLPDLTLRPLELKEGEARHDLKLDLTETPEGIRGFFEYKTALFRPVVVEQMARDLEALLELVTRDPEMRLDQLASELVELARRLRVRREDELQQSISRDLRGLKGRTGRRAATVVRRDPGDGSGSRDEERW